MSLVEHFDTNEHWPLYVSVAALNAPRVAGQDRVASGPVGSDPLRRADARHAQHGRRQT